MEIFHMSSFFLGIILVLRSGRIQKKMSPLVNYRLVIDEDTTLWESGAIMRYLSRKTNTMPEDEILKAKVDAVSDNTKDFFLPD